MIRVHSTKIKQKKQVFGDTRKTFIDPFDIKNRRDILTLWTIYFINLGIYTL